MDKKDIITIVLLFLMLVLGVSLSVFGDNTNPLLVFSFVIVTSLAAGLTATYLTGKISGSGVFGFVNIRSVGGGFAVWLITIAAFYFHPKDEIDGADKYFLLTSVVDMGLKAWVIDKNGGEIPIDKYDLYNMIEYMKVENNMFKIKLKLTKQQLSDNNSIKLSFNPVFTSKIGYIANEKRFFSPKVEGWTLMPATDGSYSFVSKPEKFKQKTELALPFIIQ